MQNKQIYWIFLRWFVPYNTLPLYNCIYIYSHRSPQTKIKKRAPTAGILPRRNILDRVGFNLHNVLLSCRWKKANKGGHSSLSFGHVVSQFWPTFYTKKREWKNKEKKGPIYHERKIAIGWVRDLLVGKECLDHPFAHQRGHSIHHLETSWLCYANLRSTKCNNTVYGFQVCTLHDSRWLFESTCRVGVIQEVWHLQHVYIMVASVLTCSTCVHFLIFRNLYPMHIPLHLLHMLGTWMVGYVHSL